jgi:hypothetical protein
VSRPPARPRTKVDHFLTFLGVALTALMAVAGLTAVAGFILISVGMASYGSNK